MQEFLVGLLFLLMLLSMVGAGIILFPLLLAGGIILSGVFVVTFIVLAIWLLGKIIIFIWNHFFKERI